MPGSKKKWSDLSPLQQRTILLGGVAELVVTAAALKDLAHRPPSAVRGPKLLWVASFVVQPFGPMGYYAFGRK